MRQLLIISVFFLVFIDAFTQGGSVQGVVMDEQSGETLIGANILIGEGKGTVTNFEGKFSVSLENGQS